MTETKGSQPAQPQPQTFKVHIKDVCFTRTYIQCNFNAPFEDYRVDAAVADLVSGSKSGPGRSKLLPLTCFVYRNYLWTVNNRRLWVLRTAFQYTALLPEIDVVLLPADSWPERKDYIHRLPAHKQEAFIHPKYQPLIHGDTPRMARISLNPVLFDFKTSVRGGFKQVDDKLVFVSPGEASATFQASTLAARQQQQQQQQQQRPQGMPGRSISQLSDDNDDVMSVASEAMSIASAFSVDYPGKSPAAFGAAAGAAPAPLDLARTPTLQERLPPVKEDEDGDSAEKKQREGEDGVKGEESSAGMGGLSSDKKAQLAEVAATFKQAVTQLRVILDNLEVAIDKLAS